jgi:plastocyanin
VGGVADGIFDSGTLFQGGTYQFTFNTAGTFNYFCVFHWAAPLNMVGVVTVTG